MSTLSEISASDEMALFNPAFLSILLHAAISEHEVVAGRGMAVHLPFLLIPLALHQPTRTDLPSKSSAQMQKWIRENPRHIAGLDKRAVSLRPFVAIAIRFASIHGVVQIEGAVLRGGALKRRPRGYADHETDDSRECQKAARLLGRWFGRQPDPATLLAIWGLRP